MLTRKLANQLKVKPRMQMNLNGIIIILSLSPTLDFGK